MGVSCDDLDVIHSDGEIDGIGGQRVPDGSLGPGERTDRGASLT